MARYKDGKRDGMLSERESEHANLPTEVMIKSYPNPYDAMPEKVDDNIMGIDQQIKGDQPARKGGFKPAKF